MKIFPHFPQQTECPLCGTHEDKECILVPIEGTQTGNNVEAVPAHVDCILRSIIYIRPLHLFYAIVPNRKGDTNG